MTERKIRRIGDILNGGQVERRAPAEIEVVSQAEVRKTVDERIDAAIARVLRKGFGFPDEGGER